MKINLSLLILLISTLCFSQENYTELTRQALEKMWDSQGKFLFKKSGYKEALKQYQDAFKIYPDSIDELGLYKASVLAGKLRNNDLAFSYLNRLLELDNPENWSYIIRDYPNTEYKNLLKDPRWKDLEQKAGLRKRNFLEQLKQTEIEFFEVNTTSIDKVRDINQLYENLKERNIYKEKLKRNYSISFSLNSSTQTSFFVHLPENYSPQKKYPLLLILHGAVTSNLLTSSQDEGVLESWNRFYTKYANQNEVILVFPKGSKEYNWMYPDDGFYIAPEIVRRIKKSISVNDNKVFVTGHSNGGTGSFSYLMKAPTQFAGCYGFNTYPKVFTGGTFVKNLKNRSFINFSTDLDYYYPPQANDQLAKVMDSLKLDYQDYRFNGFPHWFPEFDESEQAYKILFEDLTKRERNPFPKKIYWEIDNLSYGEIDWLKINKTDLSKSKKEWHKEVNFPIKSWLSYNKKDELISKSVNKKAFDFPSKSAAIKAELEDNTFRINCSRINELEIYISPEMIDLEKNVKVYIEDKLYFNDKIEYDRDFILNNFKKNRDRVQVWVNTIKIKI